MYKSSSKFSQRDTRHDLALERSLNRDKTKLKRSSKKLKNASIRRTGLAPALQLQRRVQVARITPEYLAEVGPFIMSLSGSLKIKGGNLAAELNRCGVKLPNGGTWDKVLANYVLSQLSPNS